MYNKTLLLSDSYEFSIAGGRFSYTAAGAGGGGGWKRREIWIGL
jgi:hypothetical protein